MKKGIIIQGSSNSTGNTNKIVKHVSEKTGYDYVDLRLKNIGQFEYDFKNKDDDFLPLMREIVENYEIIIFATPVYWYSMSGILKKFFDRISDCLHYEKETGRKLRTKQMAVISCSASDGLNPAYYMPFTESAKYLGMDYIGEVHTWVEDNEIPKEIETRLTDFIKKIM